MLKSRLGVTHECFASSLNAFFPSFCSAFLDTDAPFGSVGSFWDWNPDLARGGSFEANPPFVADVMLDMAIKFDALLAREAGAPLTFVVVVPGWLDDAGIRMMIASPFKRFQLTVPKDDHGFCDGAQHQRRDRYQIAAAPPRFNLAYPGSPQSLLFFFWIAMSGPMMSRIQKSDPKPRYLASASCAINPKA
jgi:phosphorylated CTD-interacting factor 1